MTPNERFYLSTIPPTERAAVKREIRSMKKPDRQEFNAAVASGGFWAPTHQSSEGNWKGDKLGMSSYTDWHADFTTLRQKSDQTYFESIQGRAILSVHEKNVVGSGLVLEYSPAWEIIDPQNRISPEDRRKFVKNVQTRFDLIMRSRDLDASGRLTGYGIQGFEFHHRLRKGETFPIIRYNPDPNRLTPIMVQFIHPDQVQTPFGKSSYKPEDPIRIIDGIEVDQNLREIAIHVLKDKTFTEFIRIPMQGKDRPNVLHPALIDDIGQVRGMPMLAPFLHDLKSITDYDVAEQESAKVNASIAGVVVPSKDEDSSRPIKTGVQLKERQVIQSIPVEPTASSERPLWKSPGMIMQALKKGEDFRSHDTARPNVNAEAYIMGKVKHMSAATGIAAEVLLQAFNSNYSASKGAIEMSWTTFEQWVYRVVAGFQLPLFEIILAEEIRAARIQAPGFEVPIIRAAYLKCEWTGVKKPDIDPLKSANAAEKRQLLGHTTGEREALLHNGTDFNSNVDRLMEENEKISQANIPIKKLENTVFNGTETDGDNLTVDEKTAEPAKTPAKAQFSAEFHEMKVRLFAMEENLEELREQSRN